MSYIVPTSFADIVSYIVSVPFLAVFLYLSFKCIKSEKLSIKTTIKASIAASLVSFAASMIVIIAAFEISKFLSIYFLSLKIIVPTTVLSLAAGIVSQSWIYSKLIPQLKDFKEALKVSLVQLAFFIIMIIAFGVLIGLLSYLTSIFKA